MIFRDVNFLALRILDLDSAKNYKSLDALTPCGILWKTRLVPEPVSLWRQNIQHPVIWSRTLAVRSVATHMSYTTKKLNSVALVRERTIPTERPPPVGEVSANFCG